MRRPGLRNAAGHRQRDRGRSSCPDRRHQRSHTEDRYHSLQVIGQDVEAHLGSDLVEGPGQKMGGAHPSLEGPKRVFDGLSSHAHGVGHAVELVLHPVEHVLMLPALDDPPLGRRAPGSERTSGAGAQVAVAVEVFRVIRAAMNFGEFCTRRAGVMVLGDETTKAERVCMDSPLGHVRIDARANCGRAVRSRAIASKLPTISRTGQPRSRCAMRVIVGRPAQSRRGTKSSMRC